MSAPGRSQALIPQRAARRVVPPSRPKGEDRRAQPEGAPVSLSRVSDGPDHASCTGMDDAVEHAAKVVPRSGRP